MDKHKNICVIGQQTEAGQAFLKVLKKEGYTNIYLWSKEDCLLDTEKICEVFTKNDIDYIFYAETNSQSSNIESFRQSVIKQMNVLDAAYRMGAFHVLLIAGAEIYPYITPEPVKEEYILSSYFHPSVEQVGLSMSLSMNLCQTYNESYGTNFQVVIPGLIYGALSDEEEKNIIAKIFKQFEQARGVEQIVMKEHPNQGLQLIFEEDFGRACLHLFHQNMPYSVINVSGKEVISYAKLISYIGSLMQYEGEVIYEGDHEESFFYKQLDVEKLYESGWKPEVSVQVGLIEVYSHFRGLGKMEVS